MMQCHGNRAHRPHPTTLRSQKETRGVATDAANTPSQIDMPGYLGYPVGLRCRYGDDRFDDLRAGSTRFLGSCYGLIRLFETFCPDDDSVNLRNSSICRKGMQAGDQEMPNVYRQGYPPKYTIFVLPSTVLAKLSIRITCNDRFLFPAFW